eukprot:scaffold2182_cov73-Cylindrotheca_fusiformis.AAC.2
MVSKVKSRNGNDRFGIGAKKMTGKLRPMSTTGCVKTGQPKNLNRQRMSDEDWVGIAPTTSTSVSTKSMGYYGSPNRYDPTWSVLQAARQDPMGRREGGSSMYSDTRDDDMSNYYYTSSRSLSTLGRDDDFSSSYYSGVDGIPNFVRDESEACAWSAATSVSLSERLNAYQKNTKALPFARRFVQGQSSVSDLTGIGSTTSSGSGGNMMYHNPLNTRGKVVVHRPVKTFVPVVPLDTSPRQLSIRTNSAPQEDIWEWNMLSPLSYATGTDREAGGPNSENSPPPRLVSKMELFNDLRESGYDKVKDIFQHIGDGASDKSDLVGRCVLAQADSSDSGTFPSKKKNKNNKGATNSIISRFFGDNFTMEKGDNTTRDDVDEAEEEEDLLDELSEASSESTDGDSFDENEVVPERKMVAAAVARVESRRHTSKHKKNKNKKPREVAVEPPAAAREETTTANNDTNNNNNNSSPQMKKPKGIMVTADSVASAKSVRFSETVETSEFVQPEAPELPSLMDDEPNDGEDASVVSMEGGGGGGEPTATATTTSSNKKQGMFQSLLRRGRGKKKNTNINTGNEMSLEPMEEEEDDEDHSYGQSARGLNPPGSISGAAAVSNNRNNSNPIPKKKGVDLDEIELIAGCTKSGKKAIMIARATDDDPQPSTSTTVSHQEPMEMERSRSRDPPPSINNNSNSNSNHHHPHVLKSAMKPAAPLAAANHHQHGAERRTLSEISAQHQNINPTSRSMKEKELKEILDATEAIASQYEEDQKTVDKVPSVDEDITAALEVIRRHADRLGIKERQLLEAVENEERSTSLTREDDGTLESEPFAATASASAASGRSTATGGSYHTSDFAREHPVAMKLIDMFDYYFTSGGSTAAASRGGCSSGGGASQDVPESLQSASL